MKRDIIHTTINLSGHHAHLLDESARKTGITPTKMAVLLLRKLMPHWKKLKNNFMTVKYQQNQPNAEWTVVHMFFAAIDYEVNIGMRNKFKWSVSAMVAAAIQMFIEEIIDGDPEKTKDQCDKYTVDDFQCEGKLNKNKICWHTIWQLSDELAAKLFD